MTLALVAPVAPSRVLWEPLNQDSPRGCPRCHVAMVRSFGPNDEADSAGRLVMETWDICLSCGTQRLVVEDADKPLSPEEWRERIRRVREHRKVCGPDCGPDAPCRQSRPGLPAPGPIEPKEATDGH